MPACGLAAITLRTSPATWIERVDAPRRRTSSSPPRNTLRPVGTPAAVVRETSTANVRTGCVPSLDATRMTWSILQPSRIE